MAKGPGDHDTGHLHVPASHNFLHLVVEVGDGGHGVEAHLLFRLQAHGREPPRRVDHHITVQEIVEGLDIPRITSGRPAGNNRKRLLQTSYCPTPRAVRKHTTSVGTDGCASAAVRITVRPFAANGAWPSAGPVRIWVAGP